MKGTVAGFYPLIAVFVNLAIKIIWVSLFICTVITGVAFFFETRYLKGAELVQGTLIGYEKDTGTNKGGAAYAPIYSFQDKNGAVREIHTDLYSGDLIGRRSKSIGTKREIYYNPAKGTIKENSFLSLWFVTIIMTCMSAGNVVMLLICKAVLRAVRKSAAAIQSK